MAFTVVVGNTRGPETVAKVCSIKHPNIDIVDIETVGFHEYLTRFGCSGSNFSRGVVKRSGLKQAIDASDGVLIVRGNQLVSRNADAVIRYCKTGVWETRYDVSHPIGSPRAHIVAQFPFGDIESLVGQTMEFVRANKIRKLCVTGSSPAVYDFEVSPWRASLMEFFKPLMKRINDDCVHPGFHQDVIEVAPQSPSWVPSRLCSSPAMDDLVVLPETPMTTIPTRPPSLKRPTRPTVVHRLLGRVVRRQPTFNQLIEEAHQEMVRAEGAKRQRFASSE